MMGSENLAYRIFSVIGDQKAYHPVITPDTVFLQIGFQVLVKDSLENGLQRIFVSFPECLDFCIVRPNPGM